MRLRPQYLTHFPLGALVALCAAVVGFSQPIVSQQPDTLNLGILVDDTGPEDESGEMFGRLI